jgi:peptidoglycan/xylan/chitin deacetylase (PgdA/CDA1 family)
MRMPVAHRLQNGLRRTQRRLGLHGIILLYHRVAEELSDPWGICVSPRHFGEHLDVIRQIGYPMPLKQIQRALLRPHSKIPIALTFDDGYADNLYNAKPLLALCDIPATIFVTTGAMDQKPIFWWDQLSYILLEHAYVPSTISLNINGSQYQWNLGDAAPDDGNLESRNDKWRAWETPPSARHAAFYDIWRLLVALREADRQRVMNDLLMLVKVDTSVFASRRMIAAQDLVELAKDGLVEIGAHTVTHSALAGLSVTEQGEEIWRSMSHISEITGGPVTSFAYPFGHRSDYSSDTVKLLREAGIVRACTGLRTTVHAWTDPLQMPRIHVNDTNGEEFARELSRWFGA